MLRHRFQGRRRQLGRRGIAAVEFALVAPVMLTLVIGVFDITKAIILRQQVYNAAHTIPLSASSLAVQPDRTTSLTVAQAQQSMSAIYAEIPWIRSGIEGGQKSVTLSSVTFVQSDPKCDPTSTVCSYVPQVAWSVAYADPPGRYPGDTNSFQSLVRPCMTLQQVGPSAGSPSDLTTLRTAGITNPDPILVVDVHYRYTPIFAKFVTGPIDFWASGYWPVRSVDPNAAVSAQYTKYDVANQNGGAGKCAGFT